MKNDLYQLLRNKEIIDILDGNKQFGETNNNVIISMPYLSGPQLCSISKIFGLSVEYNENGKTLSRWMYMDNLLEYCISKGKIQQLFNYLFSKDKFANMFNNIMQDKIDETYNYIINIIVKQISKILYFGGNEFQIINKEFIVKPINIDVDMEVPTMKTINRDYIKELSERASNDIDKSDYDSAITKCRTLLEEVFCYVIELKNEKPSESGNINTLFNQVKELYNMHQSKDIDKRINMLLSGLEKILNAISDMRNKDSDAHGVGSKRINIQEHHARLFLNSAIAMSEFILAVANKQL